MKPGVLYALFCLQGTRSEETCRPMAGGLVKDCGVPSDLFQLQDFIFEEPPRRGFPVKMHFTGRLNKVVAQGSVVSTKVIYNGFEFLTYNQDVCSLSLELNTGYPCPVAPQTFNMSFTGPIPFFTPPGKYSFTLVGYSENKERIFKSMVNLSL